MEQQYSCGHDEKFVEYIDDPETGDTFRRCYICENRDLWQAHDKMNDDIRQLSAAIDFAIAEIEDLTLGQINRTRIEGIVGRLRDSLFSDVGG